MPIVHVTILYRILGTTFVILLLTLFVSFNNFDVYADQPGSQSNPYPVYGGWQGAGYYNFVASNHETGYITDVCQLNAVNVQLTGSNLGSPYDQNKVSSCNGSTNNNNNNKGNSIVNHSIPPTITNLSGHISGQTVTLYGNVNQQSPGSSISQTTISWGDGASSPGSQYVHTYSTGGTYTVTVTATDSYGNTASASTNVTIQIVNKNNNQDPCSINPLSGQVTFNGSPNFSPLKWGITVSYYDSCNKQQRSFTSYSTTNNITFRVPIGTSLHYAVSYNPSYQLNNVQQSYFGLDCEAPVANSGYSGEFPIDVIKREYVSPSPSNGQINVGSSSTVSITYQTQTSAYVSENGAQYLCITFAQAATNNFLDWMHILDEFLRAR